MKLATDRSMREAEAAVAGPSKKLPRPPSPARGPRARPAPPLLLARRRRRPARQHHPWSSRRREQAAAPAAAICEPASEPVSGPCSSPSPPPPPPSRPAAVPAPCPCSRSSFLSSCCAACSPSTAAPRPLLPSAAVVAAAAPRSRIAADSSSSSGGGASPSMSSSSTPAPSPAAGASEGAGAGPTLTFWGPDPVPLPPRFSRIKASLIAGHEAELEASWARLIHALRAEVEHIEGLGPHLIPSVEFADLDDGAQTARFGRDLRRYGVGVVRKVLSRGFTDAAVCDTVRYLDRRREHGSRRASPAPPASAEPARTGPGAGSDPGPGPGPAAGGVGHATAGRPARLQAPRQDPTCYDCFWTPAQVRCRAHPSVLRAQRFMMSLWDTGAAADRLATRLPIAYADRIRVEGGGFDAAAAASPGGGNPAPTPAPAPAADAAPSSAAGQGLLARQSADDWITALQSSAGIIAQVDNGSLERWEPDGYGRGGTYDRIFRGQWEQYDPWQCASRVGASIDLYNGYGACSILRMFQGLLALSTTEPGMLRLLPSPRLATAYYLLRPFFSPRRPAPVCRSGPAWDAYLAPDNWELQRDPDTIIHGAVPGHAQRVTERWHPHLLLRGSLVTLPTLQPGDYILWHPDLPYHFSSGPRRGDDDAVSMLVYVPAAPLTQTNALYLARQRKAFRRGLPGPDFDSGGRGTLPEDPELRPGEPDMHAVGGDPALRAMGLSPWEEKDSAAAAPPGSAPDAEADITRLANLILFPE